MATFLYKWLAIPVFGLGVFVINGKRQNGGTVSYQTFHPIHISTTEIEHNVTDKTLEITSKIFWDDFESILSKNNKTKIDLTNEKSLADNNKWVFEYVKNHLQLQADGKAAVLNYVGFEKEDVVIYVYLEVKDIATVKKLSITNSIMHDMFDDQVEIIHAIVNGNRKSTKLDYPAKTASFDF
jgi:hypothetical protein